MDREGWLNALAAKFAPRFKEFGYEMPKFRVSVGFCSSGARSSAAAQCWHSKCSSDNTFEIFIMPDQVEPYLVANHLWHELTHATVGFDCGHKGAFATVCKAVGLNGPMTATTPGEKFKEYVKPFLDELGPMPHAKLTFDRGMSIKVPRLRIGLDEGGDDDEGEEIEVAPVGGASTAKPKQTTRLKKCECQECGYTVRVTQKWLEVGPPHCPEHGAMTPEGDDESSDE